MSLQEEVSSRLAVAYAERHATVEQRMKWAVGANPDGLTDVFDAYSSAYAQEVDSMKKLLVNAKTVCRTANTGTTACFTNSNSSGLAIIFLQKFSVSPMISATQICLKLLLEAKSQRQYLLHIMISEIG